MKYLLVSDIHGRKNVFLGLLTLLDGRGWTLEFGSDGHCYLHHESESLIFCGDNNDRGEWSLPVTYIALSSMVTPSLLRENTSSVTTLMGNHDIKLFKYFTKGYRNPRFGFDITMAQLEDENSETEASFIQKHIEKVPYWFVGRKFLAVHAYWSNPVPNKEQAIYGITEPKVKGGGLPKRIKWWELDQTPDKWIFFGHYHMLGEGLSLREGFTCLDNHDGGVHIVAEFDDTRGQLIKHHDIGAVDTNANLVRATLGVFKGRY